METKLAHKKLEKQTGRENGFANTKPLSEFLGKRSEVVLAGGNGHIKKLYQEATELWKTRAAESNGKGFSHFVAMFDCARVNMKNALLTRVGGDACIAAFMDVQAAAAKATFGPTKITGNDLFNVRVSSFSDETATHAAGYEIGPYTVNGYEKNLAVAKERIFNEREKYTFEVGIGENGESRRLKLDLRAASLVFRHEEMVVAYNTREPLVEEIKPDNPSDLIKNAISGMESKKAWLKVLPQELRFNKSIVDILDPLEAVSPDEMQERGVVIQLRYGLGERYLKPLLSILRDGWDGNGAKGLRKCHTAVISDNYAFTGLNGVWGNPFANALTTAGIRGIKEFSQGTGVRVGAVPGSHYHYWLDVDSVDIFRKEYAKKLKEHIIQTIQAKRSEAEKSEHLISTVFFPKFIALESNGRTPEELRPLFALESLGMGNLPPDALERADFVINFIENIKNGADGIPIQEKLFEQVGVSREEKEAIDSIRRYCTAYRTIRDAQDLTWVLRLNGEQELEKTFWGLSLEKGKRLKEQLLLRIESLMY